MISIVPGLEIMLHQSTAAAVEELLKLILSAVDKSTSPDWTSSTKFDHTYEPITPGLNAIRGNVLYYVYYQKLKTDKGKDVKVIFIYIQGVGASAL